MFGETRHIYIHVQLHDHPQALLKPLGRRSGEDEGRRYVSLKDGVRGCQGAWEGLPFQRRLV